MNYKIKHTRQIVTLFVTIPLAVLITALILIAIRQNLFEKRFYYFSKLENAIGISTRLPSSTRALRSAGSTALS